jgi:hypothetical protein
MDTLLTEIMVFRELRKIAQRAEAQLLLSEYHADFEGGRQFVGMSC